MKLDFKEIANAWYNSIRHTPQQKVLADKRFEICTTCPSKVETFKDKKWSFVCGACGCPLKAKVYTENTYKDKDGSCPLNKWKEAEDEWLKNFKVNKTLL